MRTLMALVLAAAASPALAGPECTTEPQANWLTEADMKQKIIEAKYSIDLFKTTSGNCYEIYGKNEAGDRVEVYFHPVTGEKILEKSL